MHDAPHEIDIAANRRARKWSARELMGRAIWEIVRTPLFAWTPRPLWTWRRALLRLFGAQIGRSVHIFPSVKIAVPWNLRIDDEAAIGDGAILYNLGMISIGSRATVSQYAHLCAGTHDYRLPDMPLLKPPISIGAGTWICAEAFVGPGVTIGDRAVVAARAVVVHNVDAEMVVAGNPARVVGVRKQLPAPTTTP
jgi:putative colanic acid biosynthesis acetyltransferase WcaF